MVGLEPIRCGGQRNLAELDVDWSFLTPRAL